MSYNSDLKEISQGIKKEMSENKEPTEEEIINWCKAYYQKGRMAMGEDPNEYE